MNLLKFAAFMAAQQANKKDQLSFLRTNIGSGDDAPVACVNEGVEVLCCLHTNAPGEDGFEGCHGCVMSVFDGLDVDWEAEDVCTELADTSICSDIAACFMEDAACNGGKCFDSIKAHMDCQKEEGQGCPDLCEVDFLSIM